MPRPAGMRGLVSTAILAWLLVFALGAAKLRVERAAPPEWANSVHHLYDGYVSIDNFSARAEYVQQRLFDRPLQASTQEALAGDGLHPTSWLIPVIVGALGWWIGSIPMAFALVAGLCQLGTMVLAGLVARRLCAGSARAFLLTACVLGFHCLSMRTGLQLYLDHAVALAGMTAVWVCLAVGPGLRRAALLCAVLTAGMLTKSSFLPALAIPALHALSQAGARRRWSDALRSLALHGAIPLLVAFLVAREHRLLHPASSIGGDFSHILGAWTLRPTQVLQWAVEMALLFQLLPLLLSPRRISAAAGERFIGLTLCAFLLGTWAFGLPAIPRLYAPVLALLGVLVGASLFQRNPEPPHLRIGLALFGALNIAIAIAAIAT